MSKSYEGDKKIWPWGHPYNLGMVHRLCGANRITPDFFPDQTDRLNYIRGYDGAPRVDFIKEQKND